MPYLIFVRVEILLTQTPAPECSYTDLSKFYEFDGMYGLFQMARRI